MANRVALVVASDRYDDPAFRPLRAPAQDVEALTLVLQDPAIGNFEVNEPLLNRPAHEVAREIQKFFSGGRRDDVLLLYFSCHGVKDADGQLYFATSTTEFKFLAATAVSAAFVANQMHDCRAKRIVLILDCCYSGAFARNAVARADEAVDVMEPFHRAEGDGRVVITASSAMEYAYEGDDLVKDRPQPSIFTRALVAGLQTGEADRDGDGQVSADELYDYVFDAVRAETPNQNPVKISTVKGTVYVARNPHRGKRDPDVVMSVRHVSSRRLALALGNDGNVAVDVALTASLAPSGPRAVIEPQRLRLGPGGHDTAVVRLDRHRPLTGAVRRHTMTVHAAGAGRDWTVEEQLEVRPRLTRLRLAAAAILVAALTTATVLALRTPGPDPFPIRHSGRIATAGQVDRYPFRARAGRVVYFDDQTDAGLAWTLLDPDGEPVFKDLDGDFGPVTLKGTGRYELSVSGRSDPVGDYAFALFDVTTPQSFTMAIGDKVYQSATIPGQGWVEGPDGHRRGASGAAWLENAGAVDEYTFTGRAGQVVYLDNQDEFGGRGLAWTLERPDGETVFADKSLWLGQDVGPVTLPSTGQYKLRVFGDGDSTGKYWFQLWQVPAAQSFPIAIGDRVHRPDDSGTGWVEGPDGSQARRPGMGRVESPGAVDEFVFQARAGQVVTFDSDNDIVNHLAWTLLDPDGHPVFEDTGLLFNGDVGPVTLTATGEYRLRVFGRGDSTGDYGFQLRPS